MMIVPTNNIDNIENKKFTIQYTKKELDQIQSEFVEQMSKYIARVNNNRIIVKTIEEIEKEAEIGEEAKRLPPTTVIKELQKKEVLK